MSAMASNFIFAVGLFTVVVAGIAALTWLICTIGQYMQDRWHRRLTA